jgi:hypothetical protein
MATNQKKKNNSEYSCENEEYYDEKNSIKSNHSSNSGPESSSKN